MKRVLLLLTLASCAQLVEPEIEGLARARAPPEAHMVYSRTSTCLGTTSIPFDSIEWFTAQRIDDTKLGAWIPPRGIVIVEACQSCPRVIAHELIHLHLQEGHTSSNAWVFEKCEAPW